LILTIFSLIILFIFSPVENKNKPLTESEIEKYRKRSIILGIAWGLLSVLMLFIKLNTSRSISLTLFSTAILMIAEINKKQKEFKNYEKRID
jgi:accessory gene regulator protein AgrB